MANRRWPALAEGSLATRALPSVDYLDVFSAPVGRDVTLEDVARRLLLGQPPRLMRLRDALVRPFGLKTSPGGSRPPLRLIPGERIGIFRLYERSAHELLLGEDDRHLDFRVCLRVVGDGEVTLATLVHFRNFLGRAYFFLIRPFHALIVKGMLRRATAPRWGNP
jgi:hypothetical protein